jgi:hypothetical protein
VSLIWNNLPSSGPSGWATVIGSDELSRRGDALRRWRPSRVDTQRRADQTAVLAVHLGQMLELRKMMTDQFGQFSATTFG